ncbi:MAG TPA: DUF3644 domain-containing protein [Bosea sp. (in: a-proteobacteria)]|jgi:hypothetical protein|uniref:DUF3644 domain-containing protein n=1 Tax=Bosea sp. (in: a-proteobacteria) TaxID=1871050 RepID=UPI002DDDB6A3|nr:DUF3644 domain-containing protein [Bosea sp. (in: a-proteobacteria)]HEV2555692.1 DUF3644 domain-containing protein [Bosea sp. (in: a-proteobacteria)]
MPAKRRGNSLLDWEIRLIKAMLGKPKSVDQDVLAYFTRPTRSINHRAISEIRNNRKHAAVPSATELELSNFLATWPDCDPHTGLSIRGDELLIKAREAMIAAVHTFNGAGLHFRAELFTVTSIIAWTYLHHAIFAREAIDYRYYEKDASGARVLKLTPGGEPKFWELSHCLKHGRCPLGKEAKENLGFLIELRHEIEHRSTNRIDEAVSAMLQSCAINFNETIKKEFGAQFGLERRLPLALQFVTFGPDQVALLKKDGSVPAHIRALMDATHAKLTPDEANDPRFAYRVALVPRVVKNPSSADAAYYVVKSGSPEAEALNQALLKEVEKRKYRAGQVVSRMRAEGFRNFSMHHHTQLWRDLDGRNPGKGFGASVFGAGDWAWYESWVTRVRQHCTEAGERYR